MHCWFFLPVVLTRPYLVYYLQYIDLIIIAWEGCWHMGPWRVRTTFSLLVIEWYVSFNTWYWCFGKDGWILAYVKQAGGRLFALPRPSTSLGLKKQVLTCPEAGTLPGKMSKHSKLHLGLLWLSGSKPFAPCAGTRTHHESRLNPTCAMDSTVTSTLHCSRMKPFSSFFQVLRGPVS